MKCVASLAFLLLACGSSDPASGSAEESSGSETESEASTETFGIRNAARPEPGIITAGQPTPAQLDAARTGGVHTVITLRAEDEPGQEWEADGLMSEGVRFTRIPVLGPEHLTEEKARLLDAALAEVAGEEGDVLLHCGSSNRVGALMALRAYYVQGKTVQEAIEVGRAAGLTRLEAPVLAHLEQACEAEARC